ncbi:MAG: toast rack family protein [Gemmatimonadales bacterium]
MNASRIRVAAICAGCVLLVNGTLAAQSFRTVTAARLTGDGESLRVNVEFAAGVLRLMPGDSRTLYRGEIYYNEEKYRPVTRYRSRQHSLTFGLKSRSGDIRVRKIKSEQRLDLALAPQVPTRLTINIGAAEAHVELGDLSITDATIKSGAAKTTVGFDRPNRTECSRLEISAGAAEFRAAHLGNARCKHVMFDGGVGDVTLDFTGVDLPRNMEAQVKLGLGQLTLRLPENLGVSIEMNRFLASFDDSGFDKRGSDYVSHNYDAALSKLHISIKAVLGDIDVEWVGR